MVNFSSTCLREAVKCRLRNLVVLTSERDASGRRLRLRVRPLQRRLRPVHPIAAEAPQPAYSEVFLWW